MNERSTVMRKAIIIGAGIGGLGAAVRLAVKGYQVDVFERTATPGGKLGLITQPGYRYDLGPSLFTMPHYVDKLFELAGERPADHFTYSKLDIVCHYFWDDHTTLRAFADPVKFAQEAHNQLGAQPDEVLRLLQDARLKYETTGHIFLEHSLHKINTWLRPDVPRALWRIPQLDLFRSMNSTHRRILKTPKLVQLFNRFATYNGSDPYRSPGLLSMIPHFEHGIGAFYPTGGMYAITEAVYGLALRQGVKFYFNTEVQKIEVRLNRATGVIANDHAYSADIVVSNMDVFFTYRQLLADQPQPERLLKQEKSSSGIVFYWGIKNSFPQLGLHNIFFSSDYKHEFDCLRQGRMSDDPTVYINITSKYTPTDAPAGCENWFVLINAPYHSGQNWSEMVAQTKANVLRKVSAILGVDVATLIEHETILDPLKIEMLTGSHLGALYGTASNHPLAAFLRHPNYSRRIGNLYFVGGSVHPGGGIPLALLSSKIVSELVS